MHVDNLSQLPRSIFKRLRRNMGVWYEHRTAFKNNTLEVEHILCVALFCSGKAE